VVGCKLGEIATSRWTLLPPGVTIVQIDIDPTELGKVYRTDHGLWGDAKLELADLAAALVADDPTITLDEAREYVARNTVAQLLVPDALRGRVMSVVMLITRGGSQLGRVQSGFTVGLIGAPFTILLGAGVIGAAVLASWLKVRMPQYLGVPVPPETEEAPEQR